MTRHDLLRLYVSKLAFLFKWSHSSQHGAYRRMLGCSWKGGGSAKNICIRKISKQKISIKNNNNNNKKKKISPSKNHKSLSIK